MFVLARHKTQKDAQGKELIQEFTDASWLSTWMPTGQWIFIERTQESRRIAAPRAIVAEPQKITITVKKSCCGRK